VAPWTRRQYCRKKKGYDTSHDYSEGMQTNE